MNIAEKLPGLDEGALANLHQNGQRLADAGGDLRAREAASLLPLIESELATRKLAKVKAAPAKRPSTAAKRPSTAAKRPSAKAKAKAEAV